MASSRITLGRTLLHRLTKSTVVPGTSSRRYYSSSSGHRHTDASSRIAEFQGPVARFVVNPLRTALYYFIDTIYPYTPTRNLRWSLNLINTSHSPACRRSLLALIKSSLLGSGWDVTETAKTLHIFRDMRGLKQDVKVWVEEGTKLTEFGEVWVENGYLYSDEGPLVIGYLLDTIYPYTSTKNLRWSLNFLNDFKSQALPKSLLEHIKYSFIRGRWDVTETAETLRFFRDMRGLEPDVKVWVEEGIELTEPGKVWVENGNYVSDEGRKVFGQLLEWDVDGGVRLRNLFLKPSVTPFMKPEELKRSELYTDLNNILFGNKKYRYCHHSITYPEMPYPSVSLFIQHDRQKGYEGNDFLPYTMRIGLPGNVYKTNDIKIEVKNELLKVIIPKMTVKRVSNLKCVLESDPV